MALIEKFHVVAAERPVATGQSIKEGMIVSLSSAGEVIKQVAGTYTKIPYGLAGDTKSTSASSMPGVAAGWQGRVSDYFDETKASGKITVYHSGGEFATDQFQNLGAATVGQAVYGVNGLLDVTDTLSSGIIVGRITALPTSYPSGVPGVDINGDQALSGDNTNTYVEFKLTI